MIYADATDRPPQYWGWGDTSISLAMDLWSLPTAQFNRRHQVINNGFAPRTVKGVRCQYLVSNAGVTLLSTQ